jgi:hypothetical protein
LDIFKWGARVVVSLGGASPVFARLAVTPVKTPAPSLRVKPANLFLHGSRLEHPGLVQRRSYAP